MRGVASAGLAASLLAFALAFALQAHRSAISATGEISGSDSYGQLPLAFAPHSGSRPSRVAYSTSTASGSVVLTRRGAVIAPSAKGAEPVRMTLAGARQASPIGRERLPGVVNDFRGNDPAAWQSNLPTFAKVSYPGVYPGTDVDYYGTDGALEYDFRLAAGADPSRIAIDFGGVPLRLASNGDLLIGRGKALIRQRAPIAYQDGAGGRKRINSRFDLRAHSVGFRLGTYDHSRPLVIDPVVVSYSTLLGGSYYDEVEGTALDGSGNQYLAGTTESADFPKTVGAFQTTLHGTADSYNSNDAFVTKLNPTGTTALYSTYLGGAAKEVAWDIAIDSSGNAYVTGQTNSDDFPSTVGAYQTTIKRQNYEDVFVTKLNSTGGALGYSTYIGGTSSDYGYSIAVDSLGAAYITGITNSRTDNTTNPIQTPYPVHNPFPGGGETGNGYGDDAFVTKLTPSGSSLDYSSYLNSTSLNDGSQGQAIAVDSAGHAYVTGNVNGDTFPTTASKLEGSTHDQANTLTADGFLTKLAANGQSLDYSTYFGGMDDDYPTDVAIDSSGRAFISGSTISEDTFDLKNQFQNHQGLYANDAFLTELDPSKSGAASLVYSTLFGGTGGQGGSAVAVDAAGDAYLGGALYGNASSFPVKGPISATANAGLFVAKFDTDQSGANSLVYSTTIPNTSTDDTITGLGALGSDVYLGGRTKTSTFQATTGAYQTTNYASYYEPDGIAMKLGYSSGPDTTAPETTITSGPANGSTISTTTATFGFNSTEPGSTFECSVDSATSYTACNSGSYTTPALGNGSHTFRVRATDGSSNTDQSPDSRTFTVNVGPPPDTTPPQTTIKSPPPATIKAKNLPVEVTFKFGSSETGSTYACKLDSGVYRSCTSPKSYKLGKGKHTFSVRATDSSGNQDSTAATSKVEIKKKPKKHHHHHHGH